MKVTAWCRKCHTPGAEQPEEIRVLSLRYDVNGDLWARLQCEKCGHEWQTKTKRAFDHLPGYREAAQHIESASLEMPRVYGRR